MKRNLKAPGFVVALAAIGLSTTSCLHMQVPDFTAPRPVVLAITGIPQAQLGREIRVGLLAAGTDLANFRDLRFEIATATSEPARITGDMITIPMFGADGEPFTTSGAYVIGILISGQVITGIGPLIPLWGGVTVTMDILGGTQAVAFADLLGAGL